MNPSRHFNAMKEVFLLLGSNVGDTIRHLDTARQLLMADVGSLSRLSSLYRTKAWGITNQPDFLNQVVVLISHYPPLEVLDRILSIEKKMGRHRLVKWGERIIDIDILYYNHQIVDYQNLKIPHPLLQERNFALVPLVEIAPDFVHPIFLLSNAELLAQSTDSLEVEKLG